MTPIAQIPHTFIQRVRDRLACEGTYRAIDNSEMVHVQFAFDNNNLNYDGAVVGAARVIAMLRQARSRT